MATRIFYHPGGAEERTLTVENDGSVTYERSHNYKIEPAREETMTPEQAKKRWPEHAAAIDEALRSASRSTSRTPPSGG